MREVSTHSFANSIFFANAGALALPLQLQRSRRRENAGPATARTPGKRCPLFCSSSVSMRYGLTRNPLMHHIKCLRLHPNKAHTEPSRLPWLVVSVDFDHHSLRLMGSPFQGENWSSICAPFQSIPRPKQDQWDCHTVAVQWGGLDQRNYAYIGYIYHTVECLRYGKTKPKP